MGPPKGECVCISGCGFSMLYVDTKLSVDLITSVAERNLKQMIANMLFYSIAARKNEVYMKHNKSVSVFLSH